MVEYKNNDASLEREVDQRGISRGFLCDPQAARISTRIFLELVDLLNIETGTKVVPDP